MDHGEYEEAVRFLRSENASQRDWPDSILNSKNKNARKVYREKWAKYLVVGDELFKSERRGKKGHPEEDREKVQLRVLRKDEIRKVMVSLHSDETGGHFGIDKTLVTPSTYSSTYYP